VSVLAQQVIPEDLVAPIVAMLDVSGLDVWIYRGAEWLIRDLKAPHVARESFIVQFEPTRVASLGADRGPGQLPESFDLVQLGLGPDVHTASLLPGDPVLGISDRDVPLSGTYQGRRRMTLTYPVLEAGAERALADHRGGQGGRARAPARRRPFDSRRPDLHRQRAGHRRRGSRRRRGPMSVAHEKKLAAEAAAQLVEDGMIVGLGTGSTVAYLLPALAVRGLDLRCVATSPATEHLARDLGIKVEPFRGAMALARLDVAIDGADQVAPSGWLVKGGGAAHTREKAVAAAAERFIVIVSSDKLVERLAPPVPLELLEFGLAATLERLGTARLRDVPISPEGGAIADYTGAFEDPAQLAAQLSATVGVVEHGLFPPELVSDVLVARGDDVERIPVTPPKTLSPASP
jgi:ribose 5-phosphate isomerase A